MMTFKDFVHLSVSHKGENEYHACNIQLKHDGKTYKAHEVSVAHRDLLFFTDSDTLNFVVDSYGDRHVAELFNVDNKED